MRTIAHISLIALSVSLALGSSAAFAQQEFTATLAGHAILPAESFVAAPNDAPVDLKTSGKYTTGKRVEALGSVMGKSFERDTSVKLPFQGQPRQGHYQNNGRRHLLGHHRQWLWL